VHGSFVLNASRGGVIDEQALIGALENGRISGAWIDTFDEEPYVGPLLAYSQVLLTPHVGSFTAESRIQMEREAVENLLRGMLLFGKHPGTRSEDVTSELP
jgi:D-3-phosphoglycerate dehydrogenase